MVQKRIFLLVIVAILVLAVAPITSAQSSYILNLVVSDQSPYPVTPGEIVTLGVQIQNTGITEASSRTIEIMPKAPFTLLPGEEKIHTINRIPGLGTHSLTYRLEVDPMAPTSAYNLDFRIFTGEVRNIFITESVSVQVEGEPSLVIDDLFTNPEDLEPGALASVTAKVKNIGTGTARNVQISLNSSHDEIKPVLAKGKVYVGDIIPGETSIAILGISVDGSAEEKTYTVTISADYDKEDGTDQTEIFSVGLPVKGTIQLDIIKKEANYERGILRVEVANKGTTEAKSLSAKLVVDGETIDIDYISSLKANKKTTFDFPLVMGGNGELVLDYIGPGIERNTENIEIVLNFVQPNQGDSSSYLILIIIVAVVGYFLYRKFIRKKKNK